MRNAIGSARGVRGASQLAAALVAVVASSIGCGPAGGTAPDGSPGTGGATAGAGGTESSDAGAGAGGAGGGVGGAGAEAGGPGGPAGAGGAPAGGAPSCMQATCSGGVLPPGIALHGIWVAPGGTVWTVGDHGYIGRHEPTAAPTDWCFCRDFDDTLNAVWGPGDDDVFAVGRNGRLLEYSSTDGWFPFFVSANVSAAMYDVSGVGENIWIVGDHGFAVQLTGPRFLRTIDRLDIDSAYALRRVFSPLTVQTYMIANRSFQLPMQNAGSGAYIFRLLGVDWLPVTAFVQDSGISVLLGMSGNSPINIFAVGQNYPSGAASSFGFVAHFDGEAWRGVELPDDVKVTRLFTDVAVGPPGLPNGAYVTPDAIFDGTTWTTSTDPVAGALLTVDLRGDEMWAAGYDGIIVRWNGSGWAISHPFGSQPPPAP